MDNKLSYSKKHPIKSIILIEVSFLLVVFIAGAIATIKQLSYNSPILISFLPTALVLLIYFTLKRKWAYFGFKSEITRSNWILYFPLLVILIVLCFQGFSSQPLETIVFYVGFAILVGFVEESIYRGIMIKILLPLGILPAILTSSILFSVTHMLNLLSGQSIGQMGLQLIYSLLIGIVLAQLFIKTGNIYPLILFHTLHNLIQFLGDGGASAILDTIVLIVLSVTAISLALSLRKNQKQNSPLLVSE
ncbi:CPBP family intramembrane metalloprotease [Lysinibacillus sp. 2017]|uniref:CPBP family intramembrane glutamic endopeptidase n=1 Tax=unclassified Lysinibacillus TaxID=2636778 RepID=UPI000D528FB3|nr:MULTISPECIES: type II CAAX endopeptidase family protein [unclassified Lysinibacillus]AWE07391.1 CPBP family intramembrane metalloprotease [Lysinibacillus sp. 2017]TGN36554.1 CPBP family intramembrane metalloprotease [Lysinibacillus sp. S2017]